jgi:DNA-binding response OmpR family regulator
VEISLNLLYNKLGGMNMQILLVEDDELIAKGLTYSFKQNEYNLVHKTNIKDTSNFLQNEKIEFIILDISLPDGNGLDLYNNIIKKLNIPTIFLTAKDDEETIVKGLELGAEDYITKPFSTKELIVRMKKIILRTKKNQIIEIQDIKFDIDKMVVYRNKEKIEFTSLEIKILHLLFMNLNKVVTRNEIIDKIWEWTGNDVNDNTVTVYLKRIREKLQTDIIITIKGIGYRIDENEK